MKERLLTTGLGLTLSAGSALVSRSAHLENWWRTQVGLDGPNALVLRWRMLRHTEPNDYWETIAGDSAANPKDQRTWQPEVIAIGESWMLQAKQARLRPAVMYYLGSSVSMVGVAQTGIDLLQPIPGEVVRQEPAYGVRVRVGQEAARMVIGHLARDSNDVVILNPTVHIESGAPNAKLYGV